MRIYTAWANLPPKTYTLKVNYLTSDGAEITTAYEQKVAFGDSYSVNSPTNFTGEYFGFVPDTLVVSGVVDETLIANAIEDVITVDVYYTDMSDKVIIVFIKDGKEINKITQNIVEGENTPIIYDFTTSDYAITGYTPSPSSINETVTTGKVYYVQYNPNKYTVTFEPGEGAVISETERTVEYNNIYNYDAAKGERVSLPTPLKTGYVFEGWHIGDRLITEKTVVDITDNATLTAKWSARKNKVEIHHVYENGLAASPTETMEVEYNTEFTVTPKVIEGYTPDPKTAQTLTMYGSNM